MPSTPRRLLRAAMQFAFRQLYGNFAWTYDAVAAAVSMGEWKAWGRAAILFACAPVRGRPPRLLEIAHGPGHLQLALRQAGCRSAGIDLSPQMSALARKRLRRAGYPAELARASVYRLPFVDGAFDAVISTFPTEFILSVDMLAEASRVLAAGGRLVVVPHAPERPAPLLGWWARLSIWSDLDMSAVRRLFEQAGFQLSVQRAAAGRSGVAVWVCEKITL